MPLNFPVKPDDDYLALLDSQGRDGQLAADTIRTAWAYIARLEQSVTEGLEEDAAARAALAPVAAATGIDPHGYYVYVLYGEDAFRPIYVGQSTNILSRLGSHMTKLDRRYRVTRVGMIKCPDQSEMHRLEFDMIRYYRPELNTQGVTLKVATDGVG